MKHLIVLGCFFLLFIGVMSAHAQTISPVDNHTAREESEGKELWQKLQAKQITCGELTDDLFASLGEYFMGQSIGDTERHAAMNQMMIGMMGEEGEEQMHIVLGKRSSGCDTSALLPSKYNFMPMMWWMLAPRAIEGMGGGEKGMMGYGSNWNNMMGGWGGTGVLGWLPMLLFWIILILVIVALVRYIAGSGKKDSEERKPLDILKERYAKGEIGKKEFEEKKKDLR